MGKHIFLNTIKAIVDNSKPEDDIEIVITDWKSTDWPLNDWVHDYIGHIPTKIISINEDGFNRGIGLNIAAENSSGNILFFNDADIMVDRPTLDMALNLNDKALFPRVRMTTSYDKLIYRRDRRWLRGFGVAIVFREWWERAGKYKSFWYNIDNWGGEDNQFFDDIKSLNIQIERPEMDNLIHQWHPRRTFNE